MIRITQSEYNALHPGRRGLWTTEREDWPNWSEVRERYMGKRTMMSGDGTCSLLVEGMSFEIIPDEAPKMITVMHRPNLDTLYSLSFPLEELGNAIALCGWMLANKILDNYAADSEVRAEIKRLSALEYLDIPEAGWFAKHATPLISFTCACGCKCDLFLRPETPRVCLDCREAADRKANGWTPANSID